VFNQMAHRMSVGLGATEIGSSDAHILDAIGRAYTEFRGRTAADLRKTIERGRTEAGRTRYRAVGLVRYAAWGFNHQRYALATR
jgi:predicted metal-dependent phosphoesterase TrpH